jgi:virginiamycin B lyase
MALGGISRMKPTGEIESFPLETPIVRLGRLALAPDGAAWFAESTSYSITRMKAGIVARHVPDSPRGGPYGVAVAGDGTVWATLQSGDQLVRIAPDGTITVTDLPRQGAGPTDVALAPDGAVWFLEFRANRVGWLKDGKIEEVEVGAESAGLSGLAVAADGAAWFGMVRHGSLGRVKAGKLDRFRLPRERARPYSVAVDGAGNVWYADIAGYVGMLPAREASR